MNWWQLVLYIGALAGVVSLGWRIWDWAWNRRLSPKLTVTVIIIFESNIPKSVKVTATNKGSKAVLLRRIGFILDGGMVYYHRAENPLCQWVRTDGSYEDSFDYEELSTTMQEQQINIQKAYVESDNFKSYYGVVPIELRCLYNEFDR